jgi:hypothetical protein
MRLSVPGSARSARRDNDAGFCPLGGTTRLGGSGGAPSGHSIVSQAVISSDAQQLNLHTVCQRAASGQLLFLG